MTRAQDLITTFGKDYDEVIKTVEALTEEQWRLKTADESWPVGVVAHHLAAQTGIEAIEWALSGHSNPFWADMNALDAANVQHARDFADCTKEETLEDLRGTFSHVVEVIGALTDEQLKSRCLTVGGGPSTIEQFILITIRLHIESHHGSIPKTISQNSTG